MPGAMPVLANTSVQPTPLAPVLGPPAEGLAGHLFRAVGARSFRVFVLLSIALVLGLADLTLTLTYLTNVGMFEGNPMARWIIAIGSPVVVVLFKMATIFISSSILYWQRRNWRGELGAWLIVLVLGYLTLHWFNYIAFSSDMTEAIVVMAADPGQVDGQWVSLQ